MAAKFFIFTAIVATVSAGVIPAAPVVTKYSAAPAVSYAYQSAAPVAAHAPVAVTAPVAAPVFTKYAAPVAPVVHAAPIAHVAPVPRVGPVAHYAPVAKAVVAEPYSPPHYDFGYSVSDPHTGDFKTQQESRVNDAVQGSYSLIDSDGFKRTVHYTADDHNGFNAVVQREPIGVVKAVAPVAPVAYAAPVAKLYH